MSSQVRAIASGSVSAQRLSARRTASAAAGRVGFDAPALVPSEAALSSRLRQHPWDPSVAWTGNFGDHSDSLRPAYLKAYVLPLLTPPDEGSGTR
jgi:hypothetical protein